MTWRTEEERSRTRWLPLGLAFLLGLLLGWWVIGWWLWPVTYTHAMASDLRPDEKQQYLMMVADSYAVTGNLALAQQRTGSWTPAQLATDLNTVQTNLKAQNPVAADSIGRLATALKVPAAGSGAGQAQAPSQQPAPAAGGGLLQRVCPGVLWVALVLAGIAVVAFLWTRWRQSQLGQGGQGGWQRRTPGGTPWGRSGAEPSQSERGTPAGPAAEPGEFGVPSWRAGAPAAGEYGGETGAQIYDAGDGEDDEIDEFGEVDQFDRDEEAPTAVSRQRPPAVPLPAEPVGTKPAAAGRTPVEAGERASGGSHLTKVDEFTATYYTGESDYDQAFDVKDTEGNMGSECGLRMVTLPGAGDGQAAAFEAWLWDPKDRFTQTKVLMSEAAYRDTATRDQLAGGESPVAIKPGTEFDLETLRFVLYGKIEEVMYAEQEPRNQIFRRLSVQLKLYQKM